jgi:hypothetical protein
VFAEINTTFLIYLTYKHTKCDERKYCPQCHSLVYCQILEHYDDSRIGYYTLCKKFDERSHIRNSVGRFEPGVLSEVLEIIDIL